MSIKCFAGEIIFFPYTCTVSITWGRTGKWCSNIFLTIFFSFLVVELKTANKKIGVRVGERGVCILMTGSNQSSPSF